MRTGTARHGEIELAYEVFGAESAEPMLFIGGLGMSMDAMPAEFATGMADRGFAFAHFDNRDAGRSTHLAKGAKYALTDLATDAVAVLDALNWDSAHIVGVSLGGMIGQVMAVHHADRVRSLTSISATPSVGFRISRPKLRTAFKVIGLNRRPITTREENGEYHVQLMRLTGSPAHPEDDWAREVGRRAFDAGLDPAAAQRHLDAYRRSGDRRAELAAVRAPTLVLHGEADPLQSLRAAHATAEAIPGARLVTFPGMGHGFPRALWPQIMSEITQHAHASCPQSTQPSTTDRI